MNTEKKKIEFQDLLNIEEKTARVFTEIYDQNFYTLYNLGVQILLQLNYFFSYSNAPDKRTPQEEYYTYCSHRFLQIPYTFRAAMMLSQHGYYFDALPLCRNLLEVLVRMKYLSTHHDLVEKMSRSETIKFTNHNGKQQKLQIKDVFDEVSKNLYSIYGNILSHLQHGGIGVLSFRSHNISAKGGKALMGPQYMPKNSSYVNNLVIMLMDCYMQNFEIFSGIDINTVEPDTKAQYILFKKDITKFFAELLKIKPDIQEWIDKFEGLHS